MTAHVETAHRPRRRAVLGLVIGLLMLGVPGVVLATIPGRGFVEICKTAAGPGVTGTFNFSVAGVTVPVPVGACSAPVEVPAGTVSVTEEFQPGLVVAGISVSPGARLISRDLAARSVTVAVAEGDASTQTVVTFANSVEFGQLKICKLAGPGVTVGTNFVFLAADRAVNVLAGPAPGGFCAPAGTFLVGTGVAVTETVPSGMQVTNIAVSPSDRATGSPNLAAGRVAVAVGTGVTEVLFTNASAPAATTTTTVPASSTTTTLPGGGVLPGSTTTTAPAGAPPTTSTTLPGGAPTTTTTTLPGGGVLPASTTTTTTPTTTTTTTLTTTTTTTPSGGPTTTTPPGGSSTTTTTVPGGGPTTTVPSGGATTTTLPSGGPTTTSTTLPGAPTTTSTTLPGAPTTTSTTLPGGGVLPASTTTTSPSGRPTTTAPPTSSPTTTVPRGAPSTTTPSAGATTTTTPPAGSPPTTVGGPLVGGPAPAGPVSRGAPTPALAETGATAWGLLPWATLAALGGLSLVVMGRREPSVAFLAPPLSITVSETGPPPAAEPESAPPPPDVDDGLDELERVLADPPPETPDSPRTDGDNARYSAPFHRRSGRGDAAVSVRRSPVSGGRRGRRRPAPWSRPLARGH